MAATAAVGRAGGIVVDMGMGSVVADMGIESVVVDMGTAGSGVVLEEDTQEIGSLSGKHTTNTLRRGVFACG